MTIFEKLWENQILREAVLLIVSALAAQFVFSAAELTAAIDEAKDWTDLWASGTAWILAFLFAFAQTAIKQIVAFGLARAAGRRLAGAGSASDAELRQTIAALPADRLERLGLARIPA